MEKNELFIGLDIGTTKIVAMIGIVNEYDKLKIIGIGKSKSLGVHRGVVNNISQTIQSIQGAINEAENNSNEKVDKVIVGIAGQHIRSLQHSDYITRENSDQVIDDTDLEKLINCSENSDVVIGSRYISGGGSTGWDTRRKLLSATANKISQILLRSSIKDMTSGFRCYSKDSLEKINYSDTNSDGYSFQIEMTLRSIVNNLSIKEIPIIFNERRLGKSKMSKSIIFEALLFLLRNGIKRWLNLKIS